MNPFPDVHHMAQDNGMFWWEFWPENSWILKQTHLTGQPRQWEVAWHSFRNVGHLSHALEEHHYPKHVWSSLDLAGNQ